MNGWFSTLFWLWNRYLPRMILLFAERCAARATQAIAAEFDAVSLALGLARLFIGFYSYLKGHEQLAWDYGGRALRMFSAIGLHTESDCPKIKALEWRHFDLSEQQMVELRRRAFWSAFSLDVSDHSSPKPHVGDILIAQ
jgi:hypothetical protein